MNDKLEDILFPKKKSMGDREWGSENYLFSYLRFYHSN